MSDESFTLETKGLDQLLKALKSNKQPTARVGILGTKNNRESSEHKNSEGLTNSDIGAIHEFGSPARNIPSRSFLRIPISDNLEKYMENSGALDPKVFNDVIKDGTVVPWLKKIVIIAESIVSDAFNSAGFGKWDSWKTPGYANEAGQILVDTQQLRNSITSEVKE